MSHRWTNAGRGGWHKKVGVKEAGTENTKRWLLAVATGKQKKLMVKPRNETVWYRSLVVAHGHTADSVRIGNTGKKRKRNAAGNRKASQGSSSNTRKAVRLHPAIALARAAASCEPATCAFLQALSMPGGSTESAWLSVKTLLNQRKDVLVKQLAIVNNHLDQANMEMAARKESRRELQQSRQQRD